MSAEITFATYIPTGKIIHIDRALNGDNCNCVCNECSDLLSGIQGQVNEHHFRHQVVKDCKASFETALHLAVKQIIVEAQEICMPGKGNLPYKNPVAEIIHKDYRPDILILDLYNKNIYIEVTVTNGISKSKKDFFVQSNLSLVEIDLTNIDRNINYEALKGLILYTHKYKSIITWEKESRSFKAKLMEIAGLTFMITLIITLLNLIFKRSKYD